jgi:hypothetical protein
MNGGAESAGAPEILLANSALAIIHSPLTINRQKNGSVNLSDICHDQRPSFDCLHLRESRTAASQRLRQTVRRLRENSANAARIRNRRRCEALYRLVDLIASWIRVLKARNRA